ncbi:conserved hypothetical protein; putative two-component sensor histidine kinase [Bradyrhizobium sp. ORS 375]|uniref:ATP-binding protein n=1 Tax=Bradyrhizobium sp. (strain ORS 375) TaxID=566679 RepID=UPI000240866F|nr:ATP-binding protein [Bradyrhizobium sp. ORS 375]CCD96904.1 conserved hypothetical protein; putative two-component sensor histidine kinase [Bradyrhizobium sp. ORS 375]
MRSTYATMIVAAFLTVLMVVAAGLTIKNLHDRVEDETKANLARLSFVLSEESSRSFKAIDLILKDAIEHLGLYNLRREGGDAKIGWRETHDFLNEKLQLLPQIDRLLIIGADGRLRNHSEVWPIPEISLADREHYRFFRDHDTSELFISEPVRNRMDGSWVMQMARRLTDSEGNFAGVLSAGVRLAYFTRLYKNIGIQNGGSISLWRSDGMILARYPFADEMIGQFYPRKSSGGTAFWDIGVDGSPRLVAVHDVDGFPLMISATMAEDAVQGSWRRDAIILLLGTAAAVAGILALLVLLGRRVRGMKESEDLLEKQNKLLAEQSERLLEAQRIGKVGHWVTDPSREAAVWSQQLFDITGLPPSESVPFETLLDLVHPEDVVGYLRAREAARAASSGYNYEFRIIRPDGEMRWVRMEAGPRGQGADSYFFGIIQDITERKMAETVAEESRLRLVDAIEALTKGFVLFDKDDRFVMSNTHFREMFPAWAALMQPGIGYEDLLRKAHETGLISPKGARFEDWLRQKRTRHLAGSKAVEHREPSGRWIQSVDHRTSDGGFVGLRTDITAFKTVQAQLEQKLAYVQAIRSDLEDQKRELEAAGAELRAARDAAQAANRAKSDFLAIMSHEIRTPLSGMVGMVDLLRGTPLTEEQKRYTVLAKESADLLLEVINDILDFSKLEAGRLQSEQIDFELPGLIESAVSFMGERAKKKNLDLKASLAPGLPQFLRGDPTRIRQVVLNLVSNAIKFTEQGSIEVRAAHCNHDDGTVGLRVEVIDTGIGMSPEIQAQIFDPFVQADTSISRKYGGSGLGLAICRQLCTAMGGSIGVESEPGRGSRFWIELTCPRGAAPVGSSEPAVDPTERELDILVAEDSPIIATLISSLLLKQGFKPTIVVNGAKAVAAISERRYDLVLMDVQMPEMDGISATKAIRQLTGPEAQVPIIALTANALVGQRETYLAAGMNDYVTKPIQPPLLFAAIRRWAPPRQMASPPLQPVDAALALPVS